MKQLCGLELGHSLGEFEKREERMGAAMCEGYKGRKIVHWILLMESPFDVY